MAEIDWRSLLIGVVVLLDLVVFADLARDELRQWRAGRRSASRRPPPSQTNFSSTSTELSQPMRSKVSAIQRSAVS